MHLNALERVKLFTLQKMHSRSVPDAFLHAVFDAFQMIYLVIFFHFFSTVLGAGAFLQCFTTVLCRKNAAYFFFSGMH